MRSQNKQILIVVQPRPVTLSVRINGKIGFQPKRRCLLGHSEGGLIAPMAASQHPDEIAFVVLLAAPGMDGEHILLDQGDLIARADGADPRELAQSDTLRRQRRAAAERNTDSAVIQAKAQSAIIHAVDALSPGDKAQIGTLSSTRKPRPRL